jgi:DNA-binding response OmpR family regulator
MCDNLAPEAMHGSESLPGDVVMRLLERYSAFAPDYPLNLQTGESPAELPLLSPWQSDPLLGGIIHMLGLQLHIKEPVRVEWRRLPSGIDCTWRFTPTPTFQVVFKSLLAGLDISLSTRTIQSTPDILATFLTARRIAEARYARLWLQLDDSSTASIHVHFLAPPRPKTLAKDSPLVLIIEDTKPIGLLLELYLRLAGFQTLVASDGMTGLELARQHAPDLITLDVMMPRKDGWEVLRELKSDERTSDVPVVMISVLKHRQTGFDFGAADYLPKPVVREDLIASVQRLTSPPSIPNRALAAFPVRPVIVTQREAHAVTSAIWTEQELWTVSEPGSAQLIENILNRSALPDLFIVDLRDSFQKSLSALHRLRLADAFDGVPILAVSAPEELDYLRTWHEGIIDAYATPEMMTRDGLASLLSIPTA